MKLRMLFCALVIFGMASCRHYTCPTYIKKDVKEVKTETEKV